MQFIKKILNYNYDLNLYLNIFNVISLVNSKYVDKTDIGIYDIPNFNSIFDLLTYNTKFRLYTSYKYNKLHRDGDKPTIQSNDTLIYIKYGLFNRDNDKPSIIKKSGLQKWYIT